MNTEKVFIGFNNNGKEILVYRKDDNTYINLLSKDNSSYPIEDIDLISLKPYSIVMKTLKHKTQKGIVKKYENDRTKIFDRNAIKIGRICSVTNLKVYITPFLDEDFVWDGKVISYSFFIHKGNKFRDIINNKKYYVLGKIRFRKLEEGCIYVSPINSDSQIFINDNLNPYPEKKEVIELAYSLKKTIKKRKKEL